MKDSDLIKKRQQEIAAQRKKEQEAELRTQQYAVQRRRLNELWERIKKINSELNPTIRLACRKKRFSQDAEQYVVETLGPLGRTDDEGISIDMGSLRNWNCDIVVTNRRGIFESDGDDYSPDIRYYSRCTRSDLHWHPLFFEWDPLLDVTYARVHTYTDDEDQSFTDWRVQTDDDIRILLRNICGERPVYQGLARIKRKEDGCWG